MYFRFMWQVKRYLLFQYEIQLEGCYHPSVNCDDNDACTIDSCDPASGCVHTSISCTIE